MEQWHCFKCKEKMIETDITASYLEITQFIKGLKCPKCGAAYLTEEYTVKVVAKGEADIEAKLG